MSLQEQMKTEGVKLDADKAPLHLVDRLATENLARVLGFGAKKYEPNNWRKGISRTRLLAAAMRHIMADLDGEEMDPESGLPHIDHAACCLMFASNLRTTRPDLDDRYKHPGFRISPGGLTFPGQTVPGVIPGVSLSGIGTLVGNACFGGELTAKNGTFGDLSIQGGKLTIDNPVIVNPDLKVPENSPTDLGAVTIGGKTYPVHPTYSPT